MGDNEKINLTMLTDFYELTMANGYFETGMADDIAYFDMFFRSVPDGGGFAVMAGVEQMIDYLDNLKFTDKDIDFLRSKGMFCEEFLEYLRNFKFSCDVWAVPEGAYSYSERAYYSGSVRRINDSSPYKSSEPYCNQSKQNCKICKG